MRDIEALLQKEDDLQKAEELANADAVAAEATAEIEQDACDIRAAPSMDLCSTEEMMQVFNEYYEGDIQGPSSTTPTSRPALMSKRQSLILTSVAKLIRWNCQIWTSVLAMQMNGM